MSSSTLRDGIKANLDAAVGILTLQTDIDNRTAIANAFATAIFSEPTLVNSSNTIGPATASVQGLMLISGTPTDAGNPVTYVKEQVDALLTLKADASSVYTKAQSDANYAPKSGAGYLSLAGGTLTGGVTGTTLSLSGQLTSTLAIGTAPFVVASTTMVTNLNANMIGGQTLANLDTRYASAGAGSSIGWGSVTGKPTTIAGYQISDAQIFRTTVYCGEYPATEATLP
jgi:hypothetical protein